MGAPEPGRHWHWIVGALFWPLVLVLLFVAGAAFGQTAKCAARDKVIARLATALRPAGRVQFRHVGAAGKVQAGRIPIDLDAQAGGRHGSRLPFWRTLRAQVAI